MFYPHTKLHRVTTHTAINTCSTHTPNYTASQHTRLLTYVLPTHQTTPCHNTHGY